MSLGSLLLGVWLILVGITWLGWIAISGPFLGGTAVITGIVWLTQAYYPVNLWKHP